MENNIKEKENFIITIEFINKKNPDEGYAIFCHSNINGIIMEFYETDKKRYTYLIMEKYKINKIIDYTINDIKNF